MQLTELSVESDDPFGTSLSDVNLGVREGEIVGIAGVSGNGQKELLETLSGESLRKYRGQIRLCDVEVNRLDPAARRGLGLTFVPEERLGRGAVPAMNLAENAVLTGAGRGLVRKGFLRLSAARAFAIETIAEFQVRGGNEHTAAESLSGGNLQKFIVGREARLAPKLMIVAQPTWGVDVGAAQLIRQALIDLRDRGVALLVISEELDELFMICDRIAVLARGRLSAAFPTAELTVESVGALMAGSVATNDTPRRDLHA